MSRSFFPCLEHRQALSLGIAYKIGTLPAHHQLADVLPALGEIDAVQETLESLVTRSSGRPVAGTDEASVAVLKGDPRMAEVLRRAVWDSIVQPTETLVVPRGSAQWRIPAHRCAAVIDELRGRGVRYAAGREMLAQRLAHQVLLRMEASGEALLAAVATRRLQPALDGADPVCVRKPYHAHSHSHRRCQRSDGDAVGGGCSFRP